MALRPIYYDTETTGIRPENDRVIEIAAYDPVLDRTFERLVNPQCPIPAEATAIHNISDVMVANAPIFADVLPEFIEFCSGETVLIAHNNDAFDVHFLRYEFERASQPFPSWKFADSLKWARRYRPDLPRHSLQFLREIYGFAANNAHRALDDVIILHQIFSTMIDDLPLEKVLELLERKQKIERMPFGKYQGRPLDQVPKEYLEWLQSSGALDKPGNQDLKAAIEELQLLVASDAPATATSGS